MKNTILTIFLSLLSISCCHKVDLTDSEKEWCHPYQQGQILVFKSNRNNFDTILVSRKEMFHTNKGCNIGIGTAQNEGVQIDLKPKACRTEFYCEVEISIIKDENEDQTLPFFRVFGLEYERNYNNSKLIEKTIPSLDRNYKAFYFEKGINCNGYGNNYLKSFYWSKKIGLLQYESTNGEIFKLITISK